MPEEFFKKVYSEPGTPPATLTPPPDVARVKPVIRLIQYDRESCESREVERVEDVFGCTREGKVTWINVDGLGDVEAIRKLGEHFGLHPLALEDVLHTEQRPKLEEYSDHYFVVTRMIHAEKAGVLDSEQVAIFLGRNFVLTFQEEAEKDAFAAVRQRIEQGHGYSRGMGHDYLCYMLLDSVVDHCFPVLECIGEEIEELEHELLDCPTRTLLHKLHIFKRALLFLRRQAWPQRDVLNALARDTTGLVAEPTRLFLRDVYDHTIQIMDIIESYRDLSAGLMDLYLSSLSNRTNETIRVLTVVTSIFIPLTFIVGVYGMNFSPEAGPLSMPELNWPYGYVTVLGVMAVVALGMLAFFRRKKWI